MTGCVPADDVPSQQMNQDEVIALLSDPLSYGPDDGADAQEIERIETHGSVVFLVGHHAFKMKKAVRFGYMDFSSLEKRKAACEAELRLNRRTAPMLYQRVVPVSRDAKGCLKLGGSGKAVEWLVMMKRFDADAGFDQLAEAGRLDASRADALADVIADFHAAGERRPEAGGASEHRRIVLSNDAELRRHKAIFPLELVETLREASLAAVEQQATLLDQRRRNGYVRLCHGDLHLRNICLVEGRPVPFDGIEFDERLASIDILYDLSFLLMDLCQRRLAPLAARLLNRYLVRLPPEDAQGCVAGLGLLPLFLATRAAVRAHVSADTVRSGDGGAATKTARHYLETALTFMVPSGPRLIAVGGLSGSGKTTVARGLAPQTGPAPGALVLRSDEMRKILFGVPPETRLGREAYEPDISQAVYGKLLNRAKLALQAGHGVILDAVFAREEERTAAAALAAELRVPFTGLWLDARAARMASRLRGRTGDASDATEAVLARQLTYDIGRVTWRRIDASAGVETTLAQARAALGR